METWRPIEGYDGYEVSDAGRVRSLDRVITFIRAGKTQHQHCKGRVLKLGKCTNAYLFVALGRGNQFLVHRLVALAFLPCENPDEMDVNHKKGNRADNRAIKLEWLTRSANHEHAHRELPRKAHSRITPVVLVKAGKRKRFSSQSAAAGFLGVVDGSVASAFSRQHRCKGWEVLSA